jgi:hypothetical protein
MCSTQTRSGPSFAAAIAHVKRERGGHWRKRLIEGLRAGDVFSAGQQHGEADLRLVAEALDGGFDPSEFSVISSSSKPSLRMNWASAFSTSSSRSCRMSTPTRETCWLESVCIGECDMLVCEIVVCCGRSSARLRLGSGNWLRCWRVRVRGGMRGAMSVGVVGLVRHRLVVIARRRGGSRPLLDRRGRRHRLIQRRKGHRRLAMRRGHVGRPLRDGARGAVGLCVICVRKILAADDFGLAVDPLQDRLKLSDALVHLVVIVLDEPVEIGELGQDFAFPGVVFFDHVVALEDLAEHHGGGLRPLQLLLAGALQAGGRANLLLAQRIALLDLAGDELLGLAAMHEELEWFGLVEHIGSH